jgi:hypothetical protein
MKSSPRQVLKIFPTLAAANKQARSALLHARNQDQNDVTEKNGELFQLTSRT